MCRPIRHNWSRNLESRQIAASSTQNHGIVRAWTVSTNGKQRRHKHGSLLSKNERRANDHEPSTRWRHSRQRAVIEGTIRLQAVEPHVESHYLVYCAAHHW